MIPRWGPKNVLWVLPGDEVGAFGQGLLESAVEPEDMGHVVHEHAAAAARP